MNYFERLRLNRNNIYNSLFSANALCVTGLLIIPAMLFNPDTVTRTGQFIFFWFLSWLSGKKNKPLITLLVIFFIVLFNLIMPYGQVLFSIGIFRITAGALFFGIHRAVTFEGLIMLSKVCIRQDLKMPGKFGKLMSESFRYLAVITESSGRITRKNFMSDIDNLMIELSNEQYSHQEQKSMYAQKTKPVGYAIIIITIILTWLPWVFRLFYTVIPAV